MNLEWVREPGSPHWEVEHRGSRAPFDVSDALFGTELLRGAVNLHQDLHFSALYLRASLQSETGPLYPGYSFVIALYENGIERYFVPAEEARQTAEWLIRKAANRPDWLAEQLAAIEFHSQNLGQAFPDGLAASDFRCAGNEELLAYYLRHQQLHKALYRFARLPEALDRGAPFFTNHLHDILRVVGIPESELAVVFEALTQPSTPSIFVEEQLEFDAVGAEITGLHPDILSTHAPEMFLDGVLRDALRRHREKWGFLTYHGYRKRSLPTETDSIHRLKAALRPGEALQRRPRRIDTASPILANAAVRKLDGRQRELFRLYGEIGRVKLYRRYHQLRNFYFLDQLVEEIGRRLGTSEWQVRCCLPEEVIAALHKGRIDPGVADRVDRCAVYYSGDGTRIVGGQDFSALLPRLLLKSSTERDPLERTGTCSCTGLARGTARIVGHKGLEATTFHPGDILVCEAADPDLLPLLRMASAVVTQQGGVTSHASVLCREIGVPTIIGVDDLLSFISDGDEVEVNAFRGTVRRLGETEANARTGLVLPRLLWDRPEFVGRKAAGLEQARQIGIRVPPFMLLSWDALRQAGSTDIAGLVAQLRHLAARLRSGIDTTDSFLLRSSASDENDPDDSHSGRYVSVECAFAENPTEAIERFIRHNEERDYRGSVMLQWCVPAVYCGVSIEGDRRTGRGEKMVVEIIDGPANTVTQGDSALRMVFDRESGELEYSSNRATDFDPFLAAGGLLDWLASLNDAVGKATYAEWGFYREEYWLFQIRGR